MSDHELENWEKLERRDAASGGMDNPFNESSSYFEDDRTFGTIMTEWLLLSGKDIETFLREDLHIQFSQEDAEAAFSELAIGKAAPNRELVNHLINVGISEELNIGEKGFRGRAAAARIVTDIRFDTAAVELAEEEKAGKDELVRRVKRHQAFPNKTQPYARTKKDQTIESGFYQDLSYLLELRFNELNTTDTPYQQEVVLANVARSVGVDPWALQGFMPLPDSHTPYQVATELASAMFDEPVSNYDIFVKTATSFFEGIQGIDVASGIRYGTPKKWAEVTKLLRMNQHQTQTEIGEKIAEDLGREAPYSHTTVYLWETGGSFPEDDRCVESIASLVNLKGSGKAVHRNQYIKLAERQQQKIQEQKSDTAETLGQFIRARRELLGIKYQDEFSAIVAKIQGRDKAWGHSTVSDWELDSRLPNTKTLPALVEALQLEEGSKGLKQFYKLAGWSPRIETADTLGEFIKALQTSLGVSNIKLGELLAEGEGKRKPWIGATVSDWKKGEAKIYLPTLKAIGNIPCVAESKTATQLFGELCAVEWTKRLQGIETAGGLIKEITDFCGQQVSSGKFGGEVAKIQGRKIPWSRSVVIRWKSGEGLSVPVFRAAIEYAGIDKYKDANDIASNILEKEWERKLDGKTSSADILAEVKDFLGLDYKELGEALAEACGRENPWVEGAIRKWLSKGRAPYMVLEALPKVVETVGGVPSETVEKVVTSVLNLVVTKKSPPDNDVDGVATVGTLVAPPEVKGGRGSPES